MRYLTVLLLAIFLVGCATVNTNVERYPNGLNLPPNDPRGVSVLRNFPSEPYDVIAEITSSAEDIAYEAQWNDLAQSMRKKAAEAGGDAVVIQQEDMPYVGTRTTPASISGTTASENLKDQKSVNYGQTALNYSYTPPITKQVFGKRSRGVVIRYKSAAYRTVLPPKSK